MRKPHLHPERWSRPPGRPYPTDVAYLDLARRVNELPGFLGGTEAAALLHRRRRWLESVEADSAGCWVWLGSVSNGYPVFYAGVKKGVTKSGVRGAFSWMIEQWHPALKHTMMPAPHARHPRTHPGCGNKLCVNPRHRTGARYSRGATGKARNTGVNRRRLTEEQVCRAKVLRHNGLSYPEIVQALGLHPTTDKLLSHAVRGFTYRWVECE